MRMKSYNVSVVGKSFAAPQFGVNAFEGEMSLVSNRSELKIYLTPEEGQIIAASAPARIERIFEDVELAITEARRRLVNGAV